MPQYSEVYTWNSEYTFSHFFHVIEKTETGKKGGEHIIPSFHSFYTISYIFLNFITTELFISYASSIETPLFLSEP
jgi:hypothetical protein